jgi:hypothetical protein
MPLLAGLVVTVVLAIGTAVAVGHLGHTTPAQPHLTRVPAGTVSQWGIELLPVATPGFCSPLQLVADRGLLSQGIGGCPVSQDAAVTAAQRGGDGAVLEAQLATITLDHSNQIPHAQPAWIVILRFQPNGLAALGGCRPYTPGCSGAPAFPGETAQIVIVDAYTGHVLLDVPVLPSDGRRPRP